ncbi:hypothetical protein [Rhodovulum sulfidophilum]|uniref:hypothetical protein n=1 Tax=Rhodovulum sulfidophilum TaxID=35806 RepID=UPI0009533E75|nr:hypothetical protein [Rhodovulum sulfidophilum]MBL3554531.1 hypothetical protein [Rhodovulum sulfidophilum]OLS48487.1 hypothetical protein BV379_09550 [Rhodovulum sulfidophilum]
MIGPVTSPSVMPVRKEQTEQQAATQAEFRPEFANIKPGDEVTHLFKLHKASDEFMHMDKFMAMIAEAEAERQWNESAEGKAWHAEQLAKQDAQPVELAVYKGGEMVGFMAGGFTAQSSIAGFLPRDWDSMSIDDLSQAFRSHGLKVVAAKDGLSMNHGQAANIMNLL